MERGSGTTPPDLFALLKINTASPPVKGSNEYLYISTVIFFYGVFLFGISLGYAHCKRKEKKWDAFVQLVHEKELREWGVRSTRTPTISRGLRPVEVSLPLRGAVHDCEVQAPLICGLSATEQKRLCSPCSASHEQIAMEELATRTTRAHQNDLMGTTKNKSVSLADSLKENP
ncbi:hypothetical protein MATL_G00242310 [Megalops atlanticus]|uniref:Uncharacterized protein n=1 Tax=Megalops atlanticus TaxID=7932 RepID=A0A9D3PGW9_MEGAT|nr:hypothetical protein MATL_G00242310 [Megalops atlanticus]